MIRVLIIDDSAFARKVLRETLTEAHGFVLLGYARDGLEALELIAQDPPDVVTLDLVMPNLDGIGFLRALRELPQVPRVVVVSATDADSDLGIQALQEGAFDLVNKPSALPVPQLYDLGDELREKVRAAAQAVRAPRPVPGHPLGALTLPLTTKRSIVVIGTSTGGPPALTRLLADMPANFPVPVVMVLHIPVGYTEALAQRLDLVSPLHVVEATHGLRLLPGMAVLAQAGVHLRVERRGADLVVALSAEPAMSAHRPAVDVLFESVAEEGARALAVVLTGMGDDGLKGALAVSAAGGTVLTEAEASCVVYGMPRAVQEARIATAEAPIQEMADLIVRYL